MARLEVAHLFQAHLAGADLFHANLEGTNLREAHLEGREIHSDDRELIEQWKHSSLAWPPADLRLVFFDRATSLDRITLGDKKSGFVSLVDAHWGDVNLSLVSWGAVNMLGDEQKAKQGNTIEGKKKTRDERLDEYRNAVRANRQLAVILRDQGLNEEADYFAYSAQKLQRVVSQRQRKFGQYLFSFFLDVLAGYGYRPVQSVIWYLVIIIGFALAYHVFGQLSLFPPDAFVYSLTSFHGRGFFPGLEHRISLHDPLVMLAAIEAVVGLLIEISFIATFTQRFFGK